MSFEEFNFKMALLHRRSQEIARMAMNMALVGSANSSNPYFVSLMKQQQKLIHESDRLLELVNTSKS